MGSYFFLSNEFVIHHRDAYDVVDILTSLGGISNFILTAAGIFGTIINDRFIQSDIIKLLYFFHNKTDSKHKDTKLQKIQLSFFDKLEVFSSLRKYLCSSN